MVVRLHQMCHQEEDWRAASATYDNRISRAVKTPRLFKHRLLDQKALNSYASVPAIAEEVDVGAVTLFTANF
jgi:hypothetical protein